MGDIHVSEVRVREAWQAGGAQALDELRATSRDQAVARGDDLADLSTCLGTAVEKLAGATTTAQAVLTEFSENLDACLAAYRATEHKSAATFNVLEAAL